MSRITVGWVVREGGLYYEITDWKRFLAVPGPKKDRDVFEDYTEASRYVEASWESGSGVPEPKIVRLVKKKTAEQKKINAELAAACLLMDAARVFGRCSERLLLEKLAEGEGESALEELKRAAWAYYSVAREPCPSCGSKAGPKVKDGMFKCSDCGLEGGPAKKVSS